MLLVYYTLAGHNTHGGKSVRSDATCHTWRYVHPVYKLKYNLTYQCRLVACAESPSGSPRLPTPVGTRSLTMQAKADSFVSLAHSDNAEVVPPTFADAELLPKLKSKHSFWRVINEYVKEKGPSPKAF